MDMNMKKFLNNPNYLNIKSYLDDKKIDSSWLEKSDYIKEICNRNRIIYPAFYYDDKNNILTSRMKDIRGYCTNSQESKYDFFEFGNIITIEKTRLESSRKKFISNLVTYIDKTDGSLLAHEYREIDVDNQSITIDFDVDCNLIKKRINDFPNEYSSVKHLLKKSNVKVLTRTVK